MVNPAGSLHEGIIAAIMDDLIGAAIISLGKSVFYVTINNVLTTLLLQGRAMWYRVELGSLS